MKACEKHIVIVEDDREMLSLLRDFLTHEGYKLSCFGSPLDALEALIKEKKQEPMPADLVISDVLMTPMHGPELMKKVRGIYPLMPFILISAFGNAGRDKIDVEGVTNGRFHFIHKPFSFAEFKKIVRKEIEVGVRDCTKYKNK